MNKFDFSDIPSYTIHSGWKCNISWGYLETHLKIMVDECGLNLDPDFQRAHVWDKEKQAKYVEYILRGGKSGRELYFNCINWNSKVMGEHVCVDGKQRLEAVRPFLRNDLEVFSNGLLKNKNLLKYKDFTGKMRLTGLDFVWNVNDLKTRKEVLQWYLDLNEDGVVHTSE